MTGEAFLLLAASSVSDACQRAIPVLAAGAPNNPRAVIQAYNTFQTWWKIVEYRRPLEFEILPEVLAGILLLEYVWPDIFAQVVKHPQLLYYLHALLTDIPNPYCVHIEIDEFRNLGIAAVNSSPLLRAIKLVHGNSKFVELMHRMPITRLPLAALREHLSLISTVDWSDNVESNTERSAMLLSGDPVQIKTAAVQPLQTDFARILLHEIVKAADLLQATTNTQAALTEEVLQQITIALFACGRVKLGGIYESNIIDIIEQLLYWPGLLPNKIRLRIVYTLGLYATDTDREVSERALTSLIQIVRHGGDTLSDIIRIHVVQVLNYYANPRHTDKIILSLLSLFQKRREDATHIKDTSTLRTVARVSLINRNDWSSRSLQLMQENLDNYETALILDLYGSTWQWPQAVDKFVMQLAQTPGQWAERIDQIQKRRAERVLEPEEIAALNERQFSDYLSAKISVQPEQPDPSGPWVMEKTWKNILTATILSNQENKWRRFFEEIGKTNHPHSVDMIAELTKEERFRTGVLGEALLDALERLRDAKIARTEEALNKLI